MRLVSVLLLCLLSLPPEASAEGLSHFQTLYDERSVETRTLSIQLVPVDEDVRFAVTLRDKETGAERRFEFEGEGASDPTPFQLAFMDHCSASVILLTVEYPWRHDLPQHVRVLETFAFRASDLEFIDITFGPLTDIALQDSTRTEEPDALMLPPVGVRCHSDADAKPFEFFRRTPG